MKKAIVFILLFALPLSACGKATDNSSQSDLSSMPAPESVFDTASVPQDIPVEADEPPVQAKSILIAYFSRTGNTKSMAEQIQTLIEGELFEIKTVNPYPDDYNACLTQASEELATDYRPELSMHVDKMDDYDVVFIGYPIWHGNTPMAIRSFLEEYSFSCKTVIPFCTSGGSGISKSVSAVRSLCPDSDVPDGLCVNSSSLNRTYELVEEWIGGLNLKMDVASSETDTNDNNESESSAITSIASQAPATPQSSSVQQSASEKSSKQEESHAMSNVSITIGGSVFSAKLYDNVATKALRDQLPMTLDMSDLNGNEKYYYLPDSLPTDSQRVGNINTGDLMLYGSDCLVLFYESFSTSYSYTRLGYVEDTSGLAAALGNGNVKVAFAVSNKSYN